MENDTFKAPNGTTFVIEEDVYKITDNIGNKVTIPKEDIIALFEYGKNKFCRPFGEIK